MLAVHLPLIKISIPFLLLIPLLFRNDDDDDSERDSGPDGEMPLLAHMGVPEVPRHVAADPTLLGSSVNPVHANMTAGPAANVRLKGTGGGTVRARSVEEPPPRRSERILKNERAAAIKEAAAAMLRPPPTPARPRRSRTVTIESPPRTEPTGGGAVLLTLGEGEIRYEPPRQLLRDWQRPSRSNHAPTHVLRQEEVARVLAVPRTRMQELFSERVVANGETRVIFPVTDRAELQQQTEERMLGARGESRWRDVSSRWKQFLAWSVIMLNDGVEAPVSMEWRICNFLEMKMRSLPPHRLIPISAVKYGTDLVMVAHRTGNDCDSLTVTEYLQAVRRMGSKPENQAPPASLEQVTKSLDYLSEAEAVGMMLARLTCSRIGEVEHLECRHLKPHGPVEDGHEIKFPSHVHHFHSNKI